MAELAACKTLAITAIFTAAVLIAWRHHRRPKEQVRSDIIVACANDNRSGAEQRVCGEFRARSRKASLPDKGPRGRVKGSRKRRE